eukprot:c26823_g1_i1 orf=284-1213(+)
MFIVNSRMKNRLQVAMAPAWLFILCLTLISHAHMVNVQAKQQTISDSDMTALINALRNSQFWTGATVISFVKRQLIPKTTLLIPTDSAIATAGVSGLPDAVLPSMLRFHTLENNLSFSALKLLPVETWLPTILPGAFLQITNNQPSNFSFFNSRVIKPDMCPSTSALIVCHGVDSVLNYTQFGMLPVMPTAPAPTLPTPPTPAPTAPLLKPTPAPAPIPPPSFKPTPAPAPIPPPSFKPTPAPAPGSQPASNNHFIALIPGSPTLSPGGSEDIQPPKPTSGSTSMSHGLMMRAAAAAGGVVAAGILLMK